jgi:uncharacterized membrane protein HdeD (DUF308 family)
VKHTSVLLRNQQILAIIHDMIVTKEKIKMKKIIAIVIGAIFVMAGIASMIKPVQAFLELGWLTGALLVGHGFERIWIMMTEKTTTPKKLFVRVMEALLGFVILGSTFARLLTDLMICYALSACVILGGVYFILNGIRTAERRNGKIIKAAIGLLIVGVGFVLMGEPAGTMLTIAYTLGTAIALLGVDIIMIALVGRKEAFKDE